MSTGAIVAIAVGALALIALFVLLGKAARSKRLQKLVRDKKKGRKIKLAEPQDAPESVPDLMTALEESLERAKKRTGGSGKRAKAAA